MDDLVLIYTHLTAGYTYQIIWAAGYFFNNFKGPLVLKCNKHFQRLFDF
jgi:hypothetical protein